LSTKDFNYQLLLTFPNQPLPSSRMYCSWLRGNCWRAFTAANKHKFWYRTWGSTKIHHINI